MKSFDVRSDQETVMTEVLGREMTCDFSTDSLKEMMSICRSVRLSASFVFPLSVADVKDASKYVHVCVSDSRRDYVFPLIRAS